MHIPDSVLSLPVAATTTVIGGIGLGYCVHRVAREQGERTTVFMGIMAAFLFSAQMVNFPLFPLMISGHLLGGVLASVVLGPWAGATVVALVLMVQCLLFGDGGVTALGANFVNMGLIGALCGHAIYRPVRQWLGGPQGILIGAMVAAWFSVILASGSFALQLAASGRSDQFFTILGWMALVHAVIGLGEAIITGLVLRFVLLTRPDLIDDPPVPRRSVRYFQAGMAGLGIALAVGLFLAPWASGYDDGLEWVGGQLGFLPGEDSAPVFSAPLPDYSVTGWESRGRAVTAFAGAVGTLAVCVIGWILSRSLSLFSSVRVVNAHEGGGNGNGNGNGKTEGIDAL